MRSRPAALRRPRDRRGRFVNYGRTVTSEPRSWATPRSGPEVAGVVAEVAARRGRVKVVGAGHSWSPVAAPEDVAMDLSALTGVTAWGDGWVRVAAGTRLRRLNDELARAGLALPVLGSIDHQSVAGATATATHGSSAIWPSLSGLVRAARLVDGGGAEVDIGPGDERLDAVRTHLGALGVLTEIEVPTVPSFTLEESVEVVPVGRIPSLVAELGSSAEFVKVWWMPHTPSALVIRHERSPGGHSSRRLVCSSPALRRFVEDWVPRAVLPPVLAWHAIRPGAVPRFNRYVSRRLSVPHGSGPSALMLTTPYPVRHYETEASVALDDGGEAFERLLSLFTGSGIEANFTAELRYGPAETGWLSPAHSRPTVHLGAYSALDRSREAYFTRFWREMATLGGRPHWGKEWPADPGDLDRIYPAAARFRAVRDALDPGRVFTNGFVARVLGP